MDNLQKEIFKGLHPQRNTFTFDDDLTISSNFDSGNLWKCILNNNQTEQPSDKPDNLPIESDNQNQGVYEFDAWICPDSFPYTEQGGYRTWFFFNITGFPKDSKSINFTIKNMGNQSKLLTSGLKPVMIELTKEEHITMKKENQTMFSQKWKRLKHKLDYNRGKEGLEVSFFHVLKENQNKDDVIYFAFTYPYTYEDAERSMQAIETKCQSNENVYFYRETVIQSLEGRNMDLITITGANKQLDQREPLVKEEGDSGALKLGKDKDRSNMFDKPTIMITSRVHCGEIPGSFMLQGMIDLLMDFNNPQSKVLLENFVFKIIPLLNPDGVARGYWRNDTQGLNLNRCYINPDPLVHPTIYGAKQVALQQHALGKLKYYADLHGHCSKKGCFIFGNTIKDPAQHIDQLLVPKLMSLNSVNFDFRESNFSDDHNNITDRKGMGRDGSGRATIYRETGIPHCFTMECNYVTGVRINTLKQRFDQDKQIKLLKEDNFITDTASNFYKNKKSPIFTPEVFKDVGRSFLISILDYECINPITRLLKDQNETLNQALDKLRKELGRDQERITTQMKGKQSKFKPVFEIMVSNKGNIKENEAKEDQIQEMMVKEEILNQSQKKSPRKQECHDDFGINEQKQSQFKECFAGNNMNGNESVGGTSDNFIDSHIRSLSVEGKEEEKTDNLIE